MYRPLSNNEYAIVSKVIYQERGLDGGLAESMFMAYTAKARALDAPEFEIFKESEVERKARLQAKTTIEPISDEAPPVEFLKALDTFSKTDEAEVSNTPKNRYEWFFGDDTLLDAKHKRLRVLFFNSHRYREQVLQSYLDDGVINGVADLETIRIALAEFHQKYPGTRKGVLSNYEIYFGDPSGFSYRTAMEREVFHSNVEYRRNFLRERNLPESWGVKEIKNYLRENALANGAVTQQQVELWEADRF